MLCNVNVPIESISECHMRPLEIRSLWLIIVRVQQQSSGWLQGLISTIVGNLKLSVTNVHVRYEDGTR